MTRLVIVFACACASAGCDWRGSSTSIGVEPGSVAIAGAAGSTSLATKAVTLSYVGTGPAGWTAETDAAWLTVWPSTGSFASSGSVLLTVGANASALAAGTYDRTVLVRTTGAIETTLRVAVEFTVTSPEMMWFSALPLLECDEGSTLPFDRSIVLSLTGASGVTWHIGADAAWLAFSPETGEFSAGQTAQITMTIDPTLLAAAVHTATVTAHDSSGQVPDALLTVNLQVNAAAAASVLDVSPRLVRLYALQGDEGPVAGEVQVSLSTGTDVGWQMLAEHPWLAGSPASGALSTGQAATVGLIADPSELGAGLYRTRVWFVTPNGEARDVAVAVSLAVRPTTTRVGMMLEYVSRVDLSVQPYGVYLSQYVSAAVESPLVVTMHGYGSHASASFSSAVTALADGRNPGWILVNLEGRGNHFYDGAAETDLFEVIDDVDRSYRIDRTRVFIEGPSMGATGAYRQIARHPDVFAGAAASDGWTDFRYWHGQYYGPAMDEYEFHPAEEIALEHASPLTHAETIRDGTVWLGVDGADTAVQPASGVKLAGRLARLGTSHTYVFNPTGGHCATYDQDALHAWLAARPALESDPDSVRVRSSRLGTAQNAWLQVDRLAWCGPLSAELVSASVPSSVAPVYDRDGSFGPAEIDATRTVAAGVCTFAATARNVERFTIASAPAATTYRVTVDGITVAEFGAGVHAFPLTVELELDAVGDVSSGSVYAGAPGAPEKRPRLEGPIMNALTDSFVVAYGSSSADDALTAKNRFEARKFCDNWAEIWHDGRWGFNAIWDERTLAGTIACTVGSDVVTGSGTKFLSEVAADQLVRLATSSAKCWHRVARVVSDTQLELTGGFFLQTGDSAVAGTAYVGATLVPVDEDELTVADLAASNVVVFGSEESSALVERICADATLPFNLPLRITEDTIALGEWTPLSGASYGIWMVYPNPIAAGRLVVLGHNVAGASGSADRIFWTREAWPWMWPEYVVFDTSLGVRLEDDGNDYTPDQYVLAGEFDRDWALPSSSTARTRVAVVTDQPSYAAGGATCLLTVDVADEFAAVVPALAAAAFAVRIDGEAWPAAFSELGGSPGTYEAALAIGEFGIGALSTVSFYVTVEVVRPAAGGLSAGRGRARFAISP